MGVYDSFVRVLHRRKYHRLGRVPRGTRNSRRIRLGKIGSKRRFRLRLKPKISWLNPISLLRKLRDAYVGIMLNMAEKRVFSYEGASIGGYGLGFVTADPFPGRPLKEYDGKVLAEIYRSVMLQGPHMLPAGV